MQVKKRVGIVLFVLVMPGILAFYRRILGIEFDGYWLAVWGYELLWMFYGAGIVAFVFGGPKCK